MSIIESLRTYLAAYSDLKEGAPLWVNYLGSEPTGYSIVPIGGAKTLEHYLNGASLREFPFAFQSMESTADDPGRLENIGFFEAFSDWLEEQTNAGSLPDLGSKKTAEVLEATTWGYLYEEGESSTGIYQIVCRLEFKQEP